MIKHDTKSSAPEALTEDERANVLLTIDRVRQRGLSYLKQCQSAEEAIKLIDDLHRAVDKVFQQETVSSPLKPACEIAAACGWKSLMPKHFPSLKP